MLPLYWPDVPVGLSPPRSARRTGAKETRMVCAITGANLEEKILVMTRSLRIDYRGIVGGIGGVKHPELKSHRLRIADMQADLRCSRIRPGLKDEAEGPLLPVSALVVSTDPP